MSSSTPRPWRTSDHLHTIVNAEGDSDAAGALELRPIRADWISVDVAWSNSYPANEARSSNGSHVLDIGRGVFVRASANLGLEDGAWTVKHVSAKQFPSGRELTRQQDERLETALVEIITRWAETHEGDLAQADDIDRNNSAQHLEKQIGEHEQALELLREQLRACEEGEPFTQFPELPTDRRR